MQATHFGKCFHFIDLNLFNSIEPSHNSFIELFFIFPTTLVCQPAQGYTSPSAEIQKKCLQIEQIESSCVKDSFWNAFSLNELTYSIQSWL